jgi:hypothetical protein
MVSECWICILEIEDDGTPFRQLPDGADYPMRAAVKSMCLELGLGVKNLYSGWGFPPNKVKVLNATWTKLTRGQNVPPDNPKFIKIHKRTEEDINLIAKRLGVGREINES